MDNPAWGDLAEVWEQLFPVRPERVEMCLRLAGPSGAVLDAGCATGALVRNLLSRGMDARGFDLDPGFVRRARSLLEGQADRIVEGGLKDLADVHPGREFDLVVCLGQTFPHLLTDSDVRSFLEGARIRLAHGGRLVLQVVADRDDRPVRILPALESAGVRLERRRILVDANRARLELAMLWGTRETRWDAEHRRWTPEQLEATAIGCGFFCEAAWADEAGNAWTGNEPGWLLVLRRT